MGMPYGTVKRVKRVKDRDDEDDALLSPEAKKKILKVLLSANITDKNQTEFIHAIERALSRAIATTEMEGDLSREGLKKSLQRAADVAKELTDAARGLVEALEAIPICAGAYYFNNQGVSKVETARWAKSLLSTINKDAAMFAIVKQAAEMARVDLAGRGSDPLNGPCLLAADIAEALQSIGLKTPHSRPSENRDGELKTSYYWQIARVCFVTASFGSKDLRNRLETGLKILEAKRSNDMS